MLTDASHTTTWRVRLVSNTPMSAHLPAVCLQHGVDLEVVDSVRDTSCDALILRTAGVWFDAVAQVGTWAASRDAPVVVWMGEASTALRVAAYDKGAADVFMPEIDPAEFAVRVRAAIARTKRHHVPETLELAAEAEVVKVVLRHRSIVGRDGPVHLTGVKWRILRHLLLHHGVAQSHAEIVGAVWGIDDDAAARHTLRTHVSALRRQLHLTDHTLQTVHGYGYQLNTRQAT